MVISFVLSKICGVLVLGLALFFGFQLGTMAVPGARGRFALEIMVPMKMASLRIGMWLNAAMMAKRRRRSLLGVLSGMLVFEMPGTFCRLCGLLKETLRFRRPKRKHLFKRRPQRIASKPEGKRVKKKRRKRLHSAIQLLATLPVMAQGAQLNLESQLKGFAVKEGLAKGVLGSTHLTPDLSKNLWEHLEASDLHDL